MITMTKNKKDSEFDLKTLIQYMEKENNLEREVVIVSIEQSIEKAARKNIKVTNDFRVHINRDDLTLHAYDTFVVSDDDTGTGIITSKQAKHYKKDAVEGDIIEIEIPPKYLGRVVANSSKQMIMQKIRDAKRTNTLMENKNRIGDIVNGTVSNIKKGDIIVTVGKSEMVLPKKEQIFKEKYEIGKSIQAVIIDVNEKSRHSPVTLSRVNRRYVESLFASEISEINDGSIVIMSVAREPGRKTKISVKSNNDKIDCVGSCIGKKGIRLKTISNALNGEKIDVVKYSDDHRQYITQALLPAKIMSVSEVDADNNVDVTVDNEQYALAVGKNGQNVSLASRLTGYKINVKKCVDTMTFEERKEHSIAELSELLGISLIDAAKLVNAGYLNVETIADEDIESFIASVDIDEITARGIHAASKAASEILSSN